MGDGIWRFDSDLTWHYHASMVRECFNIAATRVKFSRYHHVRTFIYYAICVLESALNAEMRRHEQDTKSEEDIYKKLWNTKLDKKVRSWPSEIFSEEATFDDRLFASLAQTKNVRNEVTHPKRHDHSIYLELDDIARSANDICLQISLALAQIAEWRGDPFPYWLTGWQLVGEIGNPTEVVCGSNGNSFVYSLRSLGYRDKRVEGLPLSEWEEKLMSSARDFLSMNEALTTCQHDIEPFCPSMPKKPRLCRKWWDHDLIVAR